MAPARKVMPVEIEGIRAARAAGVPMRKIAADYGLSPDWTRRIALGEVYREPPSVVTMVPRWRYITDSGRFLLLGLAQAELQRCYMDSDRTRPREVMGLIRALRGDAVRLAVETQEAQPDAQCDGLGEASGSSSPVSDVTG